MILSCEALARNIHDTVEALAEEIGRRVQARQGNMAGAVAAVCAERVLLDWFLGDMLPAQRHDSQEASDAAISD